MLEAASRPKKARQGARTFDVAIAGVATAVPPHKVSQEDVAERAKAVFPHLARLDGLYANTGSKAAMPVSLRIGITNTTVGRPVPKSFNATLSNCSRR
jgi:hypothetical protein